MIERKPLFRKMDVCHHCVRALFTSPCVLNEAFLRFTFKTSASGRKVQAHCSPAAWKQVCRVHLSFPHTLGQRVCVLLPKRGRRGGLPRERCDSGRSRSFLLMRWKRGLRYNGLLIGAAISALALQAVNAPLHGAARTPSGDYKPGTVNLGQIGQWGEELLIVVEFLPICSQNGLFVSAVDKLVQDVNGAF